MQRKTKNDPAMESNFQFSLPYFKPPIYVQMYAHFLLPCHSSCLVKIILIHWLRFLFCLLVIDYLRVLLIRWSLTLLNFAVYSLAIESRATIFYYLSLSFYNWLTASVVFGAWLGKGIVEKLRWLSANSQGGNESAQFSNAKPFRFDRSYSLTTLFVDPLANCNIVL